LFNILAEQVLRKALQGFSGGFRIGGKTISNLRYADDIVLLATSPDNYSSWRVVLKGWQKYNMLINATKTKVMANNGCVLEISVDGRKLEQVDSFMYLGSKVTSDADCVCDVKSRLALGMAVI